VVAALQEEGLLEGTFMFYMGDNGFHMGAHRMPQGKQTIFEEDIRVPFLVRGPGVRKGATVAA
jgi:arylsulfatase A-like enzyme